jgi:hypothetical protein
MNIAQKLTKSDPKEIITEINAINPNLLLNAVATDPKHLTDLIMIYQGQLQNSNKKIVDNATKRLEDLQSILDYKVVLTKMAFGLYDQEDAIQEMQTQIEFPEDNVIQMVPKNGFAKDIPTFYNRVVILGSPAEMPKEVQKLIPAANDVNKIDTIARVLINAKRPEDALNLSIDLFEKFQLKTREEVEQRFMFETLPVTKGVKLSHPEEKGLNNMSLEKWVEFLDNAKEVIKSKSNVVNMAVKDVKKSSSKDKPGFISIKTRDELIKFQKIDLALETEMVEMIAKELKVKPEDLIWEASSKAEAALLTTTTKKFAVGGVIEDAVIVNEPSTCNLAELKDKVLAMVRDKTIETNRIPNAKKYFDKGILLVTDYEHKADKEKCKQIWDAIIVEYKNGLGNNELKPATEPIVTPPANTSKVEVKGFVKTEEEDLKDRTIKAPVVDAETNINKDQIVEAAHEKAIELEQKEKSLSASEIKLRAEIQEIIDSKCLNPLNKVRFIVKKYKGELKKQGIKVPDPVKLFEELSGNTQQPSATPNPILDPAPVTTPAPNETKTEVKKEETTVVKDPKKNGLNIEQIDVKTDFPEMWKDATECKNLGDFLAYLIMILEDPDKNKDIKGISGRTATKTFVACNLATQYLNNFEESKTWDTTKKVKWWLDLKNKYINKVENKMGIKEIVSPNAAKESSGTQKAVDSSEKKGGESKKGEQNGKNAILGNTTVEKEDSKKSQPSIEKVAKDTTKEVQSKDQSVKQSSTMENTATSTPEKNVQNPPVITTEAATQSASMDAKKESESNLLELSGIEKAGDSGEQQQTVDTISSTEIKDVKDVSIQDVVPIIKEESKVGEKSPAASTVLTKEAVQDTESLPITTEKEEKSVDSPKLGENTAGANGKKPDVTGTNTKDVIPAESAKTNGEISKYDEIAKEKDVKIVKNLIEEIMLDTTSSLTFNQKIEKLASTECLKKNNKWDKCPVHEIHNFISATLKNSKSFDENKEAKEFIAATLTKKLEIQEAKKNEKKK